MPAVNLLTTDCGHGNWCVVPLPTTIAAVHGVLAKQEALIRRAFRYEIYGNQTVLGTKSKLHPINQILVNGVGQETPDEQHRVVVG